MKKNLFFIFISSFCFSQQWSISFVERNSLINIYNSTSGDNWSQKWDFEKDPKNWYGIKIKNGSVIEINLRGNSLKGSFPQNLAAFSKLQKLDLSSNQLSGEVAPSISALSSLVRLDISNNNLSGDPSASIIPLNKLEELSLGNNNFSFGNIEAFLPNFPLLKVLDVSNIGLTSIPHKITSLPLLKSLNLSKNPITQNFGNLSSFVRLSELYLSGCSLTKIPTELSTLVSLTALDLSNNNFTTAYAAPLSNFPRLEWLSLRNNQIENFPAEISALKSLVHVNFGGNKISGGLEIFLNLPNLEQIYLDNNKFSGEFPQALLQMNNLQMLSLAANQLTGEIPLKLPALTFLENNRFTKQNLRNYILNRTQPMADFTYSPQRYDKPLTVSVDIGAAASLPQSISGPEYQYLWFKNLDQKTTSTTESYYISNTTESDFAQYTCEAYYFEQLPNELLEFSLFREPVTLSKVLATAETKSELVVYPNPATDFINIRTTKLDIEKVFIFDLSGKLVLTENSKRISISHLPSATYVISIKTSSGLKSFKFIKH